MTLTTHDWREDDAGEEGPGAVVLEGELEDLRENAAEEVIWLVLHG